MPVFSFIDKVKNTVPVKAIVLIFDELQVSLAVCFIRQMMILNFHQEAFYLLMVLIDQFVDLLAQGLVKLADFLEVRLNKRFFGLPN